MKKTSIKLSEVTTYKFGGYCDNFFDIDDDSISSENIILISKIKTYLFLERVLTIVFSDEGYEGTIVKPDFNFIELNDRKAIF